MRYILQWGNQKLQEILDMLFLILCTFSEDEQAQIEQLFKENHALLYKVSYQLLRSETDAEDAVAQAFLNIMAGISLLRKNPPFCQ